MKRSMSLSLFRGVNVVFVDGNAKDTSCADLFKECFSAYISDCCPECCARNMLCLEDVEGE